MNDRDRDELLSVATDRFERRLAEECGKTRSEIADLRTEMARLHVDTVRQIADVRVEVSQSRLEVSQQFLAVSQQFLTVSDHFGTFKASAEARHTELLKWALVFWLGQALAIAGLLYRFGSR